MKARYFHHQPRRGVTAIGPIAHAVEDDDQIETWMIGQGQEPSGNRQIVVRRASRAEAWIVFPMSIRNVMGTGQLTPDSRQPTRSRA